MVDLSTEMAVLAERLGPAPGAGARARVVQFVSAQAGEGTSTVAREFAFSVAKGATRGVWLIDLNLMAGEQYSAVAAEPDRYGVLGGPVQASPDGSMFFSVTTPNEVADGQVWSDARYLEGHQVGGRKLWVTRFRRDALQPGQSVRIEVAPDYWNALRTHADYVVIDAPSADRSTAALVLSPLVDDVLLVISGEAKSTRAGAALKEAIETAGGRCPGFVFNRAPREPPSFLRRLFGGR